MLPVLLLLRSKDKRIKKLYIIENMNIRTFAVLIKLTIILYLKAHELCTSKLLCT